MAVGAAIGGSAALLWQPRDVTVFLIRLGLALLASTFKVKLPAAFSSCWWRWEG